MSLLTLEILVSIQSNVSLVSSASEDELVEEEDELDFVLDLEEDLEPEEDLELDPLDDLLPEEELELPLPRGSELSVTRLPLPFPL